MLEIWGRPYSSNVIPVIWTAEELGLAFRLELAGGSFGRLDTDDYGRINPNRMIPAVRDGDFALWESHAIIRYLSGRYGMGTLCPEDAETRAIADQWMEWCGTRAFPPVIRAFFATVRTEPCTRDPGLIAGHSREAADVFPILDRHLADRPYVAGGTFTMADIPLGAVAHRYFNIDIDRPDLPNVGAWYARLRARGPFRKHVMRFFGTNPDEWQALERAVASGGSA